MKDELEKAWAESVKALDASTGVEDLVRQGRATNRAMVQKILEIFKRDAVAIFREIQAILDEVTPETFAEFLDELRQDFEPLAQKMPEGSEERKSMESLYAKSNENARVYIDICVRWYFDAMRELKAPEIEDAQLIAKAKLREILPQAKHTKKAEMLAPAPSDYYMDIPSTQAFKTYYAYQAAAGELERVKKIMAKSSTTVTGISNGIQFDSRSTQTTITVIEDGNTIRLHLGDKNTKHLLVRALSKACKLIAPTGHPTEDKIFISYTEMEYNSTDAARRAIKIAAPRVQAGIRIDGYLKYGKGQGRRKLNFGGGSFFTSYQIADGGVYFYLNRDDIFDWRPLTKFFAPLPIFYFDLSDRAGDLVLYITLALRQNIKKIGDRYCIDIDYVNIGNLWMLPEIGEAINPGRDIVEPFSTYLPEIDKQLAKMKKAGIMPLWRLERIELSNASHANWYRGSFLRVWAKEDPLPVQLKEKQEKIVSEKTRRKHKKESDSKKIERQESSDFVSRFVADSDALPTPPPTVDVEKTTVDVEKPTVDVDSMC